MKVYAHKKDGSFMEFNLTGKGKSGGEGTVYKMAAISGLQGTFCAKVYHQEYLTRHPEKRIKLIYMIEHRPLNLTDSSGMIQICYPVFLLFDAPIGGNFIGYVMYHALDDSRDLQNIAMNVSKARFESLRKIGKPDTIGEAIFNKYPRPQNHKEIKKLLNRYKIIHNICSLVYYIHQNGHYVIGDIKPENILMTLQAGISLVDVDSIQIVDNGKLLFKNEASTPEYCPPEYLNHPSTIKPVSFDLFSIAVLFYQILIGTHPYTYTVRTSQKQNDIAGNIRSGYFACGKNKKTFNTPPCHLLFDYLPKELQAFFLRAFEGNPDSRPTALEWKDLMRTLIHAIPDSGSSCSYQSASSKSPQKPSRSPKPPKVPTSTSLSSANKGKNKLVSSGQPSTPQSPNQSGGKRKIIVWIILIILGILAAVSAFAIGGCSNIGGFPTSAYAPSNNYRAQDVVDNLCSAIVTNNFYQLENIYGDYLKRYYSKYGVHNHEVIEMCKNYDARFGVYNKSIAVRWNTLQSHSNGNGGLYVTYIIDYYIDRYDETKYTYFEIEKHLELDKDDKIISEHDVQLSKR